MGTGRFLLAKDLLATGADFAEPGEEVALDPPGYYIANPRTTVVLVAC